MRMGEKGGFMQKIYMRKLAKLHLSYSRGMLLECLTLFSRRLVLVTSVN